jgi:hypothetical protein
VHQVITQVAVAVVATTSVQSALVAQAVVVMAERLELQE